MQYTDINLMPAWMRQYVQPYTSGIGPVTRPADPYSGNMADTVSHNGLDLRYQLTNPHAGPEEGGSGGYYFGGLSGMMVNPDTGKQGAVRGYFGDDGSFQKAEWWEPKTTWIDKVLSAGPALVLGAATLGAGGFLGGGIGGGSSLEAGLANVGSSWAGGTAAATGGGGLFGQLGSGLSKLGSAFGGGNMGLFDTALQLGGAFLNKRSADRSADRLMGLSAEQEAQRRAAYGDYASGLSGLARNYQFRPVTSRTPLGTAGINAQGEAFATLSPELQRQSSQFGTLGNAEFNQLMGLDRAGMAADRLAKLRELQAPGDIAAENAMVSRLQRMGMLGAGGASGSNPWVKALTESRATRDLQSAYDVTDWVERNIQQRMANMQGLYGSQQGVMDLGIRNLGVAGDWTTRMADLTGRNFDMQDAILRARLTGNLPSDAFYGAQAQSEAARLQGSQGLIRGVLSAGTGLFSNSVPQQAPAPISVSTPSYVGPSSGGYFGAYTTPVSMPSVERKPLY